MESKEEQDAYIESFTSIIKGSLDAEKLEYDIKGRPKSIFSIRRKMLIQNVSFEEVRAAMEKGFAKALGVELVPGALSDYEKELVAQYREKYASREWRFRR